MMQGLGAGAPQPQEDRAQAMTPNGAKEATPEQQAQFDKFVQMSMVILYDPQFVQKAREMIRGPQGPVEGVADVGIAIVSRIIMQAQKERQQIDPAVILHGGWQVINYIAEVARLSAGVDLSDEDVETAYYLAADKLRAVLDKAGLTTGGPSPEQMIEQARTDVGDDQLRSALERTQKARRNPIGGAQ
jgi:hypothetical protein